MRQGNAETAVPRLLAMLCILAVFIPSFFMQGAARALFVPLSLAVGFAMIASYLLSSTFVPVALASGCCDTSRPQDNRARPDALRPARADAYGGVLAGLVGLRWLVVPGLSAVAVRRDRCGVGTRLGLEIFPRVDAGQFQLRDQGARRHADRKTEQIAKAGSGRRREGSRRSSVEISARLRRPHPVELPDQRHLPVDRAARRRPSSASPSSDEAGVGIEALKDALRDELAEQMPGRAVLVRAGRHRQRRHELRLADARRGRRQRPELRRDRAYAAKVCAELREVASLRDLQYAQALDYPTVDVKVDRARHSSSLRNRYDIHVA